ncbi:MAG: type II secretion system F family protein [Phycisphaerae bacterium]
MPWFEYEGLTPGGTAIAGHVEAANRERALADLAQIRIEVRDIRAAGQVPQSRAAISEDDLVFFNEQLASLTEAGIALDDGLAQMARDIESPRLRGWINALVADLRSGIPLDRAIAAREQGLPLLYSRVIRAGIDSGELPATLLNLNQHLRLAGNIRRLVWEVVSYPLLVAGIALTVISAFFILVVTQMKEVFADFGTALPSLTVFLLKIGEHYPLIRIATGCAVGALAAMWTSLRFSEKGLSLRESILMSIPVIGRVYRASLIARFLRSVSTAVATGIPLPQAMRLGGGATGSVWLAADAERLAAEAEKGRSVFVASQTASIIPPLFGFCVQVAVGRDALPTAIGQLARSYESRALHAQSMLRTLLFPLLVIVLGGFLAFAIVGMFLPLVTLINSVSCGGA